MEECFVLEGLFSLIGNGKNTTIDCYPVATVTRSLSTTWEFQLTYRIRTSHRSGTILDLHRLEIVKKKKK